MNDKKTPPFQFPFSNPFDRFFKMGLDIPKLMLDTVPSINVNEEKGSFKFDIAVPGMKKEDINIDIEGNVLTISCHKTESKKESVDFFSRKEFDYSSFSRSLPIPDNTNIEGISAHYTDGILCLTIPKPTKGDKAKSHKIKVE